ncbi:MAG TPA: cyclopropane-fatty-acyl-phospholipid synthase family protein [Vicinamibacteria bacterium]|nr:cyclopropane-fatty-acyl-phospholipid synthase family protein [Vicinamibacteria bacterium]
MKESFTLSTACIRESSRVAAFLDHLARSFVHRCCRHVGGGRIRLVEGGSCQEFGPRELPLTATVEVHDTSAYRAALLGGTIGAAEAYIDGLWSTDDLPGLVRLFARSDAAHHGLEGGLARLARPARVLHQLSRRNTRRGSRRNIAEHYDLGNDFYRLFLDETLAYSCGIFEDEAASLRDASVAKFDRICRKLQLSHADRIVEIGTGWGGFAIHAAHHFGCRVTTTTISREQYDLSRERVREAGLSGKVEVLLEDYRDLSGVYDKLVSIEMIEAVGHRNLDTFFAKCARLLRPEGSMLLQSITIADQRYERHRRDVDFIKRYIFPGSTIPSVTALVRSMTRASDLRLIDLDDITSHYTTTLRKWRERFLENVNAVRRLGFSEQFVRMWDFYFSYCEGGFAERYIGDVQLHFVKPSWRPTSAAS